MPIDLFEAAGLNRPQTDSGQASYPATAEKSSGVDLFKAAGVGSNDYQPSATAQTVPFETGSQMQRDWRPPAPIEQQAEPQPSIGNKLGAVPSGLYSGVAGVVNMPGNAANLALDIAAGGKPSSFRIPPLINQNPTNYAPVGPMARAIHSGSELVGSAAAAGPLAELAAPLLPAAAAPVADAMSPFQGGIAARAGQAAPLAAGGAAGQMASEVVPEPYKETARLGAMIGTGGLASAGAGAARGAIAPETAQLADLAINRYGLPLRGGQLSENRFARTADSALKSVPGSGYGGLDEDFFHAFNREFAKGIGVDDASKLTAGAVNQARKAAGNTMERIEGGAQVNIGDPQTMQDLTGWESKWANSPNFNRISPLLDGVLKNVESSGELSGDTYGKLIHKGSPIDSAMGMESADVRNAASELKSVLRNSLSRSLSPEDFTDYQQARTHYHAIMNIVKPAMQQADVVGGPAPSTGDVIPWNLRNIVNKAYEGSGAFAEPGDNRFNDLADIGQRFAKEFRSSGTAERSMIYDALKHAAGPLAGAGGVAAMEGAIPSLGHLAAGAAAIPLAARLASIPLRSQAAAKRLVARSLDQAPSPGFMARAAPPAVPLMTGEGVRELEPPQTATNPRTGLPEFSLDANQQQAAGAQTPADPRQPIVDGLISRLPGGASPDPAMAKPDGLNAWIDQNKPQLRALFGGQGIQNIVATAAMLRRSAASPDGTTAFSVYSKNLPQGVQSPTDLATRAMLNPAIAKELSGLANGGRVSRFSQQRLAKLLSGGAAPAAAKRTAAPMSNPS